MPLGNKNTQNPKLNLNQQALYQLMSELYDCVQL